MNILNQKQEELKSDCFVKGFFVGVIGMFAVWIYFVVAGLYL